MTLERVLLVHDYGGGRGGAEILHREIRRRLRERGVEARLLTSDADPFDEESTPDHVFTGSTGPLRALRETVNPSAARVLRSVLHDFDPQVVHLGMVLTQASPLVLPFLAERPSVLLVDDYRPVCPRGTRLLPDGTACESPPGRACLTGGCFGLKGWIPRMVQLGLLRRWMDAIDRVIVPSEGMRRILEAFGQRVDEVILHGAPGRRPATAEPAPVPTVAYAGRLAPEKGVDTLLRAMARVRRSCPDVRLLVVGAGPERRRLEQLARELGIGRAVEFTGHRPWAEAQEILAAAWIQCVPSLWHEPFGLVTVEAMARGTTVIASRVGAQPELIAHGETGYLVPPGDPEQLAEVIRSAVLDPSARTRIARAGRKHAEEALSFDTMIDRLLTVYQQLV
ncbi:MAG: glycosyltransferase family 4 protein [Gemmatimonadota bacterium]|jgi:glycosyltransferase involved in cell wall biosynthesis